MAYMSVLLGATTAVYTIQANMRVPPHPPLGQDVRLAIATAVKPVCQWRGWKASTFA